MIHSRGLYAFQHHFGHLNLQVSLEAVQKRHKQGWLDEFTDNLDELMARIRHYKRKEQAVSIGYHGNAVDLW